MKHTCTHCRQNLRAVHPLEVRRAADMASLYSAELKSRTPEDKFTKPPKYEIRDNYGWERLARATSFEILKEEGFDNKIPWHVTWMNVSNWLRDGYLPPGYILVKDKDLDEECAIACYQTEKYVPDPEGNVTVRGYWGDPNVFYKARRVVTKIEPRVHVDGCCRSVLK
jgi:hypothetical protein